MLNIKRVLTILASILLIFSFASCSKVDPDYGMVSRPENGSEESVADKASNYDEEDKIMSLDRVMSNFFDLSLFDEENYADIYLGKNFDIDATFTGDTFSVPAKIDKVEKMGWTLSEGNEYDKNSLVFAYETIDTVFENEKGVKIKAQFYNSSRSSVTLAECNIVKFRIENDFYKDSQNYAPFNINGISNTMGVTDIIDILGTPSHFYAVSEDNYYLDYFITEKDRRNGITVYVNPVEDSITAIEFSYYK